MTSWENQVYLGRQKNAEVTLQFQSSPRLRLRIIFAQGSRILY